jgi:hypothetical protein
MIGSPPVVVLDDVDELRSPADREALWAALAWLTGWAVHLDGGRKSSLTVVASCSEPAEALSAVPPERLQLLALTEVHPTLEKVR